MFYLNYLVNLIPLKFREGSVIIKAKTKPEEVLLVLKGEVLNETTNCVFTGGSIIGETDIIYKRVSG